MDFELTEDQLALQEMLHNLVERECPAALLRAVVEERDDGGSFWKTLVEGHWPGLAVPEELGGGGATAVELIIAIEQLGWAGDPTPFLATTTQYLPLVVECAPEGVRAELAQSASSGASGAAVWTDAEITATRAGDGWVLQGTAHHVPDADRSEHLAVVANTDGGIGVFFLDADAAAITRTPAFDRSLHLADVVLDGVTVAEASAAVGAEVADRIDRARQWAVTGIATATVGASQRAFDIALEHIKQRHQFNVPIGSFQALKHMAVDVLVAIERARALSQFAALAIADDDPRRALAASMAKSAAGDCQRIAVRHSIQFFGGLGYTWENDVQLFARRAKAGELLFGSGPQHRAEVARIALATGPAWEVAR